MPEGTGTPVVVGVDGGGTKTDLVVVDATGDLVGRASGGGANWEGVGVDAVGVVLGELLDRALGAAGRDRQDVAAWVCCLAGVDWPSDPDRLAPVLDRLGVGGDRLVLNDSFAALRAGTTGPVGCVSIAGTGAVCAGRNARGEVARTMGVGIGEGSGAWTIVTGALGAVAEAHHHSGPATALTDRLLAGAGVADADAFFEGVTRGTVPVGADLAPLVIEVAAAGDPVAVEVVRSAGTRHGRDLAGLADRLGLGTEDVEVVLAGGVHVHGAGDFRDAFCETVLAAVPGARFVVLEAAPVVGAALLALELAGWPAEAVRPALAAAVGGATVGGAE